MDLQLDQRLTQSLSPQMLQSIRILQMNHLELRDYLQEIMLENPVLEEAESPPPQTEGEDDPLLQKLKWLRAADTGNSTYYREDARSLVEQTPDRRSEADTESLYSHLRGQIRFETLSPELCAAVECVLQCLDGDGRLQESADEIAALSGTACDTAREAIRLVQSLEPVGVAAKSLSECLALQLLRLGENGLALTIAREHLEDLAKDHYHHISRVTGAGQAEVRDACALIRALDPRPGNAFTAWETPAYVVPEVLIVRGRDGFAAVMNEWALPSFEISDYYTRMLETSESAEVRVYLSEKLRQAGWVLQCLEQRRSTLLSCAGCIALKQEPFFRCGPGHLQPLKLTDVAAELGVHPSTVSRSVRGKYLQCDYGLFPMKYFFSRAIAEENGGKGIAVDRVKGAIVSIIGDHPKNCVNLRSGVE